LSLDHGRQHECVGGGQVGVEFDAGINDWGAVLYSAGEFHESRMREDIDQLRCAMNWADTQKSNVGNFRDELSDDLEQAKSYLQEQIYRAQKKCGPEPISGQDKAKMRWDSCMRRYQRNI